jgi:hypothetical protein
MAGRVALEDLGDAASKATRWPVGPVVMSA